jgi:hypothetical protein
MCPTIAFPPCPIARPWGGVVNVAPGIRACSPTATLEGGTQICPCSIKAFQSLVPREGMFYASLNLDEITLQRHTQLSTRGEGCRQAGTHFAISIYPTPSRHPRPGVPEPEQPGVPGVIAGISPRFPSPALCHTPHKGSVCPDSAPGSRATRFWSQTTTTLFGGATKGPR